MPTRSVYNSITSNGLFPTNIEKSNIPPIVLHVTVGGVFVRRMSIALEFISKTPLLSGLPAGRREEHYSLERLILTLSSKFRDYKSYKYAATLQTIT